MNLGHTLIIPKTEVNHWFDVSEKEYLQVAINAKMIAKAIKKSVDCPRVGTIVAGFEVPHYHMHLIPAWEISDLSFSHAQRRSEAEMKDVQKKILENLAGYFRLL